MSGRAAILQRPATLTVGELYDNRGGGAYWCVEAPAKGKYRMVRASDGWTLLAHTVTLYADGTIEWDYSTEGRWPSVDPNGRRHAHDKGRTLESLSPPRIDLSAMPKIEMDLLCSELLDATQRFYKDPKNVAAFEKWKKEREREANEQKAVQSGADGANAPDAGGAAGDALSGAGAAAGGAAG